VGDRFFLTDRGFAAGEFTLDGKLKNVIATDAAALSSSSDDKALFIRGATGPLMKVDLQGRKLWSNPLVAGRLPVPPVEVDGKLFVLSTNGTLYGINSVTGRTVWRYQTTPQLYGFSAPLVTDDTVYVAAVDGTLSAIDIIPQPSDRALNNSKSASLIAQEFDARSNRRWLPRW